jgi:bacterioferritin-associated ferredoxin
VVFWEIDVLGLEDDNGIQYHQGYEVGMYVCVCNGVTDREVSEAIEAGAKTRTAVTHACGAGGDCGSCHRTIDEMIASKCPADALIAAQSLVRERAA